MAAPHGTAVPVSTGAYDGVPVLSRDGQFGKTTRCVFVVSVLSPHQLCCHQSGVSAVFDFPLSLLSPGVWFSSRRVDVTLASSAGHSTTYSVVVKTLPHPAAVSTELVLVTVRA